MKIFRYKKPSWKTIAGLTAAKRRAKRSLGISQVEAWTKPSRIKQRARGRLGWYSPTARTVRNVSKGKVPTPFGLFNSKRRRRS